MKQRLDALTQLKDKTQKQYEQASTDLSTEKKKRQEIENNLKLAEVKAKGFKDQIDTLQAKLTAQEKSQQQRPGTVLVSDEAMKTLEKERDKFRTAATDAETKLNAIQEALKTAETKLAEKEESLKNLEEKWDAEKSYLEVSLDNERKTIERENKQHLEKVRTLEEIIKGKDELISSKEETLNDKEKNMRKYEESSKNAIQEKDKKIQEVEGRLIRSEKTVKELQIRLYQLEQSRKDVANRLKDLGKKSGKTGQILQTAGKRAEGRKNQSKIRKAIVRGEIHSCQPVFGKGQQEIQGKGGKLETRKRHAQREIEGGKRKSPGYRENQRGA